MTCVLEDAAVPSGAMQRDRGPAGDLTRRAVLASSAAALPLLLVACKGVQSLGTPPPPAPDVTTLRAAIETEKLMVARYAAALKSMRSQLPISVTPRDMAPVLVVETVQAEHSGHLAQLRSRLIEPAASTPSPSPAPTVQPSGSPTAELMALEQAEQAASDRLIGQLAGLPPSLAQLFASIAASEASHVPYLQAARRGR